MKKSLRIGKSVAKDYQKLVSEVSKIGGMISHFRSMVKIYSNTVSSWDKKVADGFLLGSHFVYHSPYDGKLLWGDFYTVKQKNVIVKSEIIDVKVCNYFVSLAYEAFEKFLRSITTRIIINNKKAAELANKELGFSSYRSCFLYLQKKYKENNEILSLLRKLNPQLDNSFKTKIGLRNFLNFCRVYTMCRNHIIHADGFISMDTIKKQDAVDEKFAVRYFGVRKGGRRDKWTIDTRGTHREALQTIVELAFLLITSFDSNSLK